MVNFARTSIKNNGRKGKDISLYVLIRPTAVRPGEIKQIQYDGKHLVRINGKGCLFLKQQPGQWLRGDNGGSAVEQFGDFKVLGLNRNTIIDNNGALALISHEREEGPLDGRG